MERKATTVAAYLSALPPDRRAALETVRQLILTSLPAGYEEVLQYGMLAYVVPLQTFPSGYLGRKTEPLPYICLASQKNYMTLHMMGLYGQGQSEFRTRYEATGKRLDLGKACIRFKKVEDLALGVIRKEVARWPVKKWIEVCVR